MYNVDFKRLAIQLLPTFLRQQLIFGVLRAGLVSVEAVHCAFLDRRAGHIYRLTHNGQVCYLTAALNDHFDPSLRRFRLMTVERQGEWLYAVSENGENIPVATAEGLEGNENVPIVYDEIMLNAEQNTFVVYVPYDVFQTRLDAVKTLVDQYKLVTKRAVYVQQSAKTVGSTTTTITFDDVLEAYKYGYVSAELSEELKKERNNIISNADRRIYNN